MRAIKIVLSFAFVAISLACSAQNYWKKANKAADKGNHTEALRLYRLALQENPEEPYLLFNIASTLYELEDYQEGIAVATQAISLDSTDARPYFCRAKCYGALEKYTSAISDYSRSIKLDPQDFSYFNRGLCKFYLEDWRAALQDFTMAAEKNPTKYTAYLYRGNCYEELGQFDTALAEYSKAAALNKKDPWVFLDRGYLLYTMGRLHAAKADYLAALNLEPENVNANLTVAELCFITGKYDSAYQFAKTAGKYAEEPDDKVIGLIFRCIAGKFTDQDISNDEMELSIGLQRYLEPEWFFNDVRTYLSGAPIDAARRQYALEWIEQYEAHTDYD